MIWILSIALVLTWALGLRSAFHDLRPEGWAERALTYLWPLLYLLAFGWAVGQDLQLAWQNRRPLHRPLAPKPVTISLSARVDGTLTKIADVRAEIAMAALRGFEERVRLHDDGTPWTRAQHAEYGRLRANATRTGRERDDITRGQHVDGFAFRIFRRAIRAVDRLLGLAT